MSLEKIFNKGCDIVIKRNLERAKEVYDYFSGSDINYAAEMAIGILETSTVSGGEIDEQISTYRQSMTKPGLLPRLEQTAVENYLERAQRGKSLGFDIKYTELGYEDMKRENPALAQFIDETVQLHEQYNNLLDPIKLKSFASKLYSLLRTQAQIDSLKGEE
ncbi:hypothetical protein KY312_02945 [Candidatus Woesearchaeota archaeon]|nr:hypothetical protein [Candidatus Woesearchaeota archaeon]